MTKPHSQFTLFGKRRFLPFFLTQLSGAFNDNLFKQALILAILYKIGSNADTSLLINLCALLFILPFFLFSALGGQLGEKYAKERLIRAIKAGEIFIMLGGAAGLLLGNLPLLLTVLFCMGTQSALFGPVKYSVLPKLLENHELVGGNALVEMGTFLAILAGTITAGVMMASEGYAQLVAGSVVLVAVAGYLASRAVPVTGASLPSLEMDWNLFRQTGAILRMGLGQRLSVSRSLLCERLSGHKVEIGLVPFGSFGLTLFGLLLWWWSGGFPQAAMPHDWLALLGIGQAWWVLASVLGIGVFGGFYIVPLYALIQARTPEHERARVVAANNILNALLMVASALVAILLLSVAELSIPQLFLVVSLMNVAVSAYIFSIVPEFSMRFLVWLLGHSMYRVRHQGLDAIPEEGPAVLVCNHVSYVDALLIAGAVRRPVRFVMYYKIFRIPVLNFIFRTAGAVPIAARHEDEAIYTEAFERVSHYLSNGEVVCIFPEGKLTTDGEINEFKAGVERILEANPVPVVPMALRGLWGSFFSRDPDKGFFRRIWSQVDLIASSPVAASEASRQQLQAQVNLLRGDRR